MSEDEHRRRGEAADRLWQEIKRSVAEGVVFGATPRQDFFSERWQRHEWLPRSASKCPLMMLPVIETAITITGFTERR